MILTIDEAREVWKKFYPTLEQSADSFDQRISFMQAMEGTALFIYDGKTNFLPLQYEPENDFYAIVGGMCAERNRMTFTMDFLLNNPEVPANVYIDFIDVPFEGCIDGMCPNFFVDTSKLTTFDDYAARFTPKQRKNWRHDLAKFADVEYIVMPDRDAAYTQMKAWNTESFGTHSDFNQGYGWIYDNYVRHENTLFYGLYLGGELQSISLYTEYPNVYECNVWGRRPGINNLGKLVFKQEIEMAIRAKKKRILFMPTYSRWKVEFKLDTEPVYRFKKGTISDIVEDTGCEIPMSERLKLKERGLL